MKLLFDLLPKLDKTLPSFGITEKKKKDAEKEKKKKKADDEDFSLRLRSKQYTKEIVG